MPNVFSETLNQIWRNRKQKAQRYERAEYERFFHFEKFDLKLEFMFRGNLIFTSRSLYSQVRKLNVLTSSCENCNKLSKSNPG